MRDAIRVSSSMNEIKGVKKKGLGIIGSRSLNYDMADKVGQVVEYALGREYHIVSGGAMGADQYVIERLLQLGQAHRGTVYSAWQHVKGFPLVIREMMQEFKEMSGQVVWGLSSNKDHALGVKVALLARNQKMVEACHGIVAFVTGGSRGTIYTLKAAAKKRKPMVVFPVSNAAFQSTCDPVLLPVIDHVKWVPLRCGGCWAGSFKAVYL